MSAERLTLKDIPMLSTSPLSLRRLRSLTEPSLEFQDQLSDVLNGEEYTQWAPNLCRNEVEWLIDYLDKVCRRVTFLRSPLKPP